MHFAKQLPGCHGEKGLGKATPVEQARGLGRKPWRQGWVQDRAGRGPEDRSVLPGRRKGTRGLPPQVQEAATQKTYQKQRQQRAERTSLSWRQAGTGRPGDWQMALVAPHPALPGAGRRWDSWALPLTWKCPEAASPQPPGHSTFPSPSLACCLKDTD